MCVMLKKTTFIITLNFPPARPPLQQSKGKIQKNEALDEFRGLPLRIFNLNFRERILNVTYISELQSRGQQ